MSDLEDRNLILRDAYLAFAEEIGTADIFEEDLKRYIRMATPAGVSDDLAFVAMAWGLRHKLGWKRIRCIFDYTLNNCPEPESFYPTWLHLALCQLDDEKESACTIAQDAVELVHSARRTQPDNLVYIYLHGVFLYKSAIYCKKNELLDEAIRVLHSAAKEEDPEFQTSILVYLGHCKYAQQEWEESLKFYQACDLAEVAANSNDLGISDTELISRIAHCKSMLSH